MSTAATASIRWRVRELYSQTSYTDSNTTGWGIETCQREIKIRIKTLLFFRVGTFQSYSLSEARDARLPQTPPSIIRRISDSEVDPHAAIVYSWAVLVHSRIYGSAARLMVQPATQVVTHIQTADESIWSSARQRCEAGQSAAWLYRANRLVMTRATPTTPLLSLAFSSLHVLREVCSWTQWVRGAYNTRA
jgi:hypothetical protein